MLFNKIKKAAGPALVMLCASCQVMEQVADTPEEQEVFGVTPENWLPKSQRMMGKQRSAIRVVYNLTEQEPFKQYVGRELQFYTPVKLVQTPFENGHLYYLEDADVTQHEDVYESVQLVGVRGAFCYSPTPVSSRVTALLRIKLKGQPNAIYAQYEYTRATKPDEEEVYDATIKRAPWEPKGTPEGRSLLNTMLKIDLTANKEMGLD